MPPDVSARELVQQIWDEVAAERSLRPTPDAGLVDYDRLLEDGERHYINSHYVLDRSPHDSESGRRPLALARRRLRARAARFVVQVLARYFTDEQEFLAHLVRLQNKITVHVDRLSEEIRTLEAVLQAESDRLRTADAVLHARLEDRISTLEAELARLRGQDEGGGP